MQFLSLVLAVAASASASSIVKLTAQQANKFPPLQITNLVVQSAPRGNTTVQFHVYDPSPYTNASTTCSGVYSTRSGPAVGQYTLCKLPEFEWTFQTYNNATSFEIGLGHTFEDNDVGQPPYNYINSFSQAPVNNTNVKCIKGYKQTTCIQPKNSTIYALVYALTA